ncbi:MAG: VOC family protein [Saprospiraceae bacterium]
MIKRDIFQFAVVVPDYDQAIDFYTKKLNFILKEDTQLSESKRWVVISPSSNASCSILLAKAANQKQIDSIGNQTGGRVFIFLHTDNIEQEYQNMISHHIKIVRDISTEAYGKVFVFEDIFGNLWDVIEPFKSIQNG